MKRNKRPGEAELKAFYAETDASKTLPASETDTSAPADQGKQAPVARPYVCPSCHRPLRSRKESCGHCGYAGYIPMSETETKRIRTILFVILFIAALAVYFLTR